MTEDQTTETKAAVAAATTKSHPLERIIDDPFASMYLASIMTATAITTVLTGMFIVSVFLG